MNNLPIADLLAFGVIGICAVISMMRGAIAEIGSLLTWVIAFMAAKWFAIPVSGMAFQSVNPEALALALGFVSVFFGVWLVLGLLRSLLNGAVSAVGLGPLNRLLGGAFGAVKGVAMVTLAVMVGSLTDLPHTEGWRSSVSIPYFESLAEIAKPYLPFGGRNSNGITDSDTSSL
ncbi:CvpA family protein [Neisseria chenwenguii]|uniref:Colicin V production protein n=1 Tax=Neisseria chenwenguii TaxID=1853278 RepID=A0A220S448_9NEIS|nr:CvpA family protein [Neisseria chenwenguii]ASK28118.1 colicin V production protein [Neisseria chenwenguii]ROV57268.1 CvpA family protein [Neisseria chenwenguii]